MPPKSSSNDPTVWLTDRLAEHEPTPKRARRRMGQLSISKLMLLVAVVAVLVAGKEVPGEALRAIQELTAGENHDKNHISKHAYYRILYSDLAGDVDRMLLAGAKAGKKIEVAGKEYPITPETRKYFHDMRVYHEGELMAHENAVKNGYPHICGREPAAP